MVWHDTPRQQFVSLFVKMENGVLAQLCNLRTPQPTFAQPTIQVLLQLCSTLADIINLEQKFPLLATRGREGIIEPECDELEQIWKITMWKVATLMPAEKAQLAFLLGELMSGPAILVGHQ